MIKSNYIVYDCETGGLDPKQNPITQFACCILDGKTLKEIDRWETFVKPYNDLKYEQKALEGTMVTMSDINSGISIKQFNKTFVEFLKQHQIKTKYSSAGRLIAIGQNIIFDIGFLQYAFAIDKINYHEYIYENFIDTYPLAKMAWGIKGDEKLNLTANCERAKVNLTDAHGAMNDVIATAELFRYFAKKLRSSKGESTNDKTSRLKGSEFFEFKCEK